MIILFYTYAIICFIIFIISTFHLFTQKGKERVLSSIDVVGVRRTLLSLIIGYIVVILVFVLFIPFSPLITLLKIIKKLLMKEV